MGIYSDAEVGALTEEVLCDDLHGKEMKDFRGEKIFGLWNGYDWSDSFTIIKPDCSVSIFMGDDGFYNHRYKHSNVKMLSFMEEMHEVCVLNDKGEVFHHSFCGEEPNSGMTKLGIEDVGSLGHCDRGFLLYKTNKDPKTWEHRLFH